MHIIVFFIQNNQKIIQNNTSKELFPTINDDKVCIIKNINRCEVYLDNAATTKVDKQVALEMIKYMNYDIIDHSNIIKSTIKVINKALNNDDIDKTKVIFTSGGTESNNIIIQNILYNTIEKKKNKI